MDELPRLQLPGETNGINVVIPASRCTALPDRGRPARWMDFWPRRSLAKMSPKLAPRCLCKAVGALISIRSLPNPRPLVSV